MRVSQYQLAFDSVTPPILQCYNDLLMNRLIVKMINRLINDIEKQLVAALLSQTVMSVLSAVGRSCTV